MRVAITGDRNWPNAHAIARALMTLNPATDYVVLGDARGADRFARESCQALGLFHRVHCADWRKHGPAAGPIRNAAMLNDLQASGDNQEVWYFHDDLQNSVGTRNCVEQARRRGLTVRDGCKLGDGNDAAT